MEEALNPMNPSIPLIPSSSSSSCSNYYPQSAPAMDSRIWRHLPQPLLDRIIAFLPPPAFFRSRAVCKRFYSLLFSDTFLELHLRVSPSLPSFLFFPNSNPIPPNPNPNYYSAFLFDPHSSSWHRLSFHLHPPNSNNSNNNNTDNSITDDFSPSASSGGLICFLSNPAGPKSLLLLNPLSRLTALLPPSPRPRLLPSVGLSISPSSLTLLLAGDDLISPFAVKNISSETFHADVALLPLFSSWSPLAPLPRLSSFDPPRPMPFSHGAFFTISSGPFSVLSYHLPSNHWTKIQAPMRRFLRSPNLVALGDKIVMLAAVEKRKLSVPKSIRVWELQMDHGTTTSTGWAEVERMPPEIYRQFSEVEGGQGFECASSSGVHGDFVAITIKNSTHILIFDFGRKDWRWAPPCPFFAGAGGLKGFGYEPRLATPAVGLIDSASLAFQGFTA